jgi:hypothetical protein
LGDYVLLTVRFAMPTSGFLIPVQAKFRVAVQTMRIEDGAYAPLRMAGNGSDRRDPCAMSTSGVSQRRTASRIAYPLGTRQASFAKID